LFEATEKEVHAEQLQLEKVFYFCDDAIDFASELIDYFYSV